MGDFVVHYSGTLPPRCAFFCTDAWREFGFILARGNVELGWAKECVQLLNATCIKRHAVGFVKDNSVLRGVLRKRHHESLNYLTLADVCYGRGPERPRLMPNMIHA